MSSNPGAKQAWHVGVLVIMLGTWARDPLKDSGASLAIWGLCFVGAVLDDLGNFLTNTSCWFCY